MRKLEPKSAFIIQFCSWIQHLGKETRVSSGEFAAFDRVEICSESQLLIICTLIDLKQWVSLGVTNAFTRADFVEEDLDCPQIVIWEDDWTARQLIVKSRIAALLGISQKIPARLTVPRRIDKKRAGDFLTRNHLQGSVASKIRYGLFLPQRYYRVLDQRFGEELPDSEFLVAVATFSYPRIFRRGDVPYRSYELIRFSSLLNSTVIGGLSKLINAFVKDFNPGDIMTYADLEWSEGGSYAKMGFQAVSETPRIPFWLDPVSQHRFNSKLPVEEQAGKVLIYNLGSRKFVKDYPGNAEK